MDLQISGSGVATLTATGTATITGAAKLFGSGSVHTIIKKTATVWEVISALNAYDTDALTYISGADITNQYWDNTLNDLVMSLKGFDNSVTSTGAQWTAQSASHWSDIAAAWVFRKGMVAAAAPTDFANGHTLTITGAPTHSVDGFAFDGTADSMAVADHADFDVSTTLTVMAWVRISASAGATNRGAVSQNDTGVAGSRSWYLGNNTSGFLNAVISTTGSATAKDYRGTVDLRDGAWHHIAFTFAADDLQLYTDGAVIAAPTKTTDAACATLCNSPANLMVGSTQTSGVPSGFFMGAIRNVVIVKKTLTAADILAHKIQTQAY